MICRVESSLVERSEVKGRERREGKFEEFERERQKKSSSSTSPFPLQSLRPQELLDLAYQPWPPLKSSPSAESESYPFSLFCIKLDLGGN